jgi:hypothetical protein
MAGIGLQGNLPALPGARIDTHGLQSDGQKAGRYLFAGGDDRIILAGVVNGSIGASNAGHVLHPADQLVGLARHGRHHDRHLMTGLNLTLHVTRDGANTLQIGDRCAAKFKDQTSHGRFTDLSSTGRAGAGRPK